MLARVRAVTPKEAAHLIAILLLIPSIGALLMWLTRSRATRSHWALSAAIGLALLSANGLYWLLPTTPLEVSTWEPAELFQARLLLRLDLSALALTASISLLLLTIYVTGPARPGSASPITRLLGAGYTGLALAAVMADNLLSVALIWGLADVCAFLFLLPAAEDEATVTGLTRRFTVQVISVLLVLAAAMPARVYEQSIGTGWQSALLAAAVLVRVGLWPLHVGLPPLPGVRRGLGSLVRLLPAAMGLAALDRHLPAEVPLLVRLALIALGGLSIAFGAIRWLAAEDRLQERPFLVLLFAGLGVTAAGVGQPSGVHAVAAAGCGLLLAGGLSSIYVPHQAWHRALGWAAAVLLAGLPWTVNHGLVSLAAWAVTADLPAQLGSLGLLLGLAAAAIGMAGLADVRLAGWESGEGFVRGAYGLGLVLPLVGIVLVGILLTGSLTRAGLLAAAGVVTVSITGFLILRRGDARLVQAAAATTGRSAARLQHSARQLWRWVGRNVGRGVRQLAALLEGRSGMLWVYVALLAIGLALAGGGQTP
jgi:hypothetical protein